MSQKKRTPKETLMDATTARAIRAVTAPERDYAPEAARTLWARAAGGDFDEEKVLPFLQAVATAILAGKPPASAVGLYRDKVGRTWADEIATEYTRVWVDLSPDTLPPVEKILNHLKVEPRAAGLRPSSLRAAAERARENARKLNSK